MRLEMWSGQLGPGTGDSESRLTAMLSGWLSITRPYLPLPGPVLGFAHCSGKFRDTVCTLIYSME
jgi:hypothetical protein